ARYWVRTNDRRTSSAISRGCALPGFRSEGQSTILAADVVGEVENVGFRFAARALCTPGAVLAERAVAPCPTRCLRLSMRGRNRLPLTSPRPQCSSSTCKTILGPSAECLSAQASIFQRSKRLLARRAGYSVQPDHATSQSFTSPKQCQ